ncbi:peptidase M23 [Microbacterium sp. cx-59]|uniref:peptidase M23 n=1 Tax=Microbacterium sp. cx-59 TaxID=2891207 RepID=UPI001E4DDBBE|nr:peptidase M23 [Microbacterium sp. cx-59]MCC4908134.1 peptidase M23 [Microbacterium sp. cx-59]
MHARPPARPVRRKPARRRRTRRAWLIAFGILIPVLIGGGLVWGGGFAFTALAAALDDAVDGVTVPAFDPDAALPPAPVPPNIAGYGVEQLGNACTILRAGRDLGFDDRDQTIAIMTAMGESSLRNIDYGDWETSGVTNPDGSRTTSIGLFQQQDNWGTREQRLDAYTAATLFYRAMAARIPDRAALDPTIVAHNTQINADANHYARYWDRAVRVVAALGGTPLANDKLDGIPLCPAG